MIKLLMRLTGFYLNLLAFVAPKAAGKKGFELFCTPFAKPIQAHQKAFLDTAEQFHFQHQQLRIQVYKWGHGPKKILFLHGWQSHSFRWKNYIEALPAAEYTCIALDAPAHGLSQGKQLNAVLYSDVIYQFMQQHGTFHTVVTHSLGSFSTLFSFYRFQTLPMDKFVVMAAPGEVRDFMTFYRDTLKLSKIAVRQIDRYFKEVIGEAPDYFSTTRFAASVSVPGLIIHDEKDPDAPHKYAVAVHQNWNNAELLTTKGLGHNLRSATVVKKVVEFIN